MSEPKKTRLIGTATTRPCTVCLKTKDRFKDFKPRWSRCAKHRIKGQKGDPACAECVKLVNGNTRQPKCIECDSKRTSKKGTKVAPTPVVAAPVAAQVVEPVVEPVQVAHVATATAAPAPEATTVTLATAPPVAAPEPVAAIQVEAAPAPVEVAPKPKAKRNSLASLADLAKLMDAPASDEPGSSPGPF
jgi:hypothetical protein